MAVELKEIDGGRLLEVHVQGKLTRKDYEEFVPEADRLIGELGKIRVLLDMSDFHGWSLGAVWEDVKFDLRHFSDIERLAMVGEKKGQKNMSRFCRPFTTARIRYFDHDDLDAARQWAEAA